MGDKGEGGVKILYKWVTLFMKGPKPLFFLAATYAASSAGCWCIQWRQLAQFMYAKWPPIISNIDISPRFFSSPILE